MTNEEKAALREAASNPVFGKCALGVGCDEVGICYAAAHNNPENCGRSYTIPIEAAAVVAEVVRRTRREAFEEAARLLDQKSQEHASAACKADAGLIRDTAIMRSLTHAECARAIRARSGESTP